MKTDSNARTQIFWGVALVAFLIRVLHNQSLLQDPLYYAPLGGNLPYLLLAEEIAAGDLFPSGAFTINSPLYPYLVALLYKLFGVGSFFAVRLVGAAADAATCGLVAVLAFRHFGRLAGWAAGLSLALFAPAVFFSTELAPVPFTLLLLVGALVLVDGRGSYVRFGLAGLLAGLAAGTRPNVLLAAPLLAAVPLVRALPRGRALGLTTLTGVALGLAPVTLMNVVASGDFVLLTRSGGHNLYIGHNPTAEAQYTLPSSLDGDIFQSMKELAEAAEGRPLAEQEVSPFYLRRALGHIATAPGREARLLGKRLLLLFNDFEATTYASFDYQRSFSPWLRWGPSMSWLLLLAVPGSLLALGRRKYHLWIPFLAAAATILLFFYIARLRILMVPTLAIFAGAAVARGVELARRGDRAAVVAAGVVGLMAMGIAELPLLRTDTSNEWNKAGGVLRIQGRYEESARALDNALRANPQNPDTYLNLAALHRSTGRLAEAEAAERQAQALLDEQRVRGDAFREGLTRPGG